MINEDTYNARVKLGSVVATPAALRLMLVNGADPYQLLNRHATGDWFDMDLQDQAANKYAAANGLRVFSAYLVNQTERVWIITEADRSSTCILLPSEY